MAGLEASQLAGIAVFERDTAGDLLLTWCYPAVAQTVRDVVVLKTGMRSPRSLSPSLPPPLSLSLSLSLSLCLSFSEITHRLMHARRIAELEAGKPGGGTLRTL
jgi:hypothetical protein